MNKNLFCCSYFCWTTLREKDSRSSPIGFCFQLSSMSRCFPFPPPGYERKVRANNVEVLKQEYREKKHKKEKRDKEKREGKEKKAKDRGDEKHRDKKEKKDKHRNKKDEEKDKERERDRSSTSNVKNQPVQVGHINKEKLLDHKGAPALQAGEKFTEKDKDKIRNSIADSKRCVTLGGQNGERVVSANHVSSRVSDAKCIQELAKRLNNDQCSGTEQASAILDLKKNDVKGQLLCKTSGAGLETKDRRHNNEKRMNAHLIKEQTGLKGTVKVQSFAEAPDRMKLQEIAKPSEVNAIEMEWQEVMTGREGDDKQGNKLKDHYIDKSKVKVKESRKKEEKSKVNSDQEKSKAGNKNGMLGSPNLNSLQPLKEPNRSVAVEGNLKKRKAETNGFLLGDEVRANKLQKQAQPPVKNGMESHQISSRPVPINNVKVNKEEKKMNGHASSPVSPLHHPPSSAAQASSSVKPPPHRDSKFLGEILKVPKLDELPDLDDDQGWLFSSSSTTKKKKSNGGRWCVNPEKEEVWGECIHIESADIYALPYVFPY